MPAVFAQYFPGLENLKADEFRQDVNAEVYFGRRGRSAAAGQRELAGLADLPAEIESHDDKPACTDHPSELKYRLLMAVVRPASLGNVVRAAIYGRGPGAAGSPAAFAAIKMDVYRLDSPAPDRGSGDAMVPWQESLFALVDQTPRVDRGAIAIDLRYAWTTSGRYTRSIWWNGPVGTPPDQAAISDQRDV